MFEAADAVVIGAGVVGLAVARALAMSGREVLVIEAEAAIGEGTSSRNSEVIHAGIYYPRGSLKARLCVRGRDLLYGFCARNGVAAEAIGKLIVAVTPEELPALQALVATAAGNGVDNLQPLDAAAARTLEPALHCEAALLSPSTGIVDSHGYMLALQGEAEAHGAMVVHRTRVLRGRVGVSGMLLDIADADGAEMTLSCRSIVNCAGHGAHAIARDMAGLDPCSIPPRYLAKGRYLTVSGASPFRHLIYPMPVPGALGVHVTLDLGGRIKLGPDISWVDEMDFTVEPEIIDGFRQSVRRYWPDVMERELELGYAGVRPKIHGPESSFADFMISGPEAHGIPGLVNLFGIESPGLTASLAIAEMVAGQIAGIAPAPSFSTN
ncbi:MAG: NAD(P)/FAD-dependent oxidoreductase [Proteobacteria bacterium]|nr:NAD(P)/FAD-dependent oxidoreductase [Pseudomonadota bacterium]